MEKKICTDCLINKDITEFNKNKNREDGLQTSCRDCNKIYKKKYYLENKERVLEKSKKYYDDNRNKILERVAIWAEKNIDKTKNYKKNYVEKNRDLINKRMSGRKKNEPILKLKMLYRSKLNKILGSHKESTFELIGCSPNHLKEHLEKQFKNGMSWDNHGLYGWHIDHIIPLSSAKTTEEMKKLCHFTNLQPLWALENIRKRNKLNY